MKANLYTLEGKKTKEVDLPSQFNEEYHPDLIKRAVQAIQANKRQPYGAKPDAGQRASAVLSRRRRKYRGSYGHGISRVPRKIMTRRGIHFYWVAAFAPGTVGGRRAHPPKAEKIWKQKINIKERKKAIRSALNATTLLDLVKARGHKTETAPYILDSKAEELNKTKDVVQLLIKLGLQEELNRAAIKKVRAGKGKNRGRKYKKRVGPLIVASKDCSLLKAAVNIPGVDVTIINNLNTELLAPGTQPGRLTIFTEAALQKLEKEKLFLINSKKQEESKVATKKPITKKPATKKEVKK